MAGILATTAGTEELVALREAHEFSLGFSRGLGWGFFRALCICHIIFDTTGLSALDLVTDCMTIFSVSDAAGANVT